jgi:hypothetical protein
MFCSILMYTEAAFRLSNLLSMPPFIATAASRYKYAPQALRDLSTLEEDKTAQTHNSDRRPGR